MVLTKRKIVIKSTLNQILFKPILAHVNIFYCFDGIIPISFIYQAVSEFYLTLFDCFSVSDTFVFCQYLLLKVNFGWLIRSLHRWSSSLMALGIILHISRVFLTDGFAKPRELIWVSEVILAVITASFGVIGYSLPWDQLGF